MADPQSSSETSDLGSRIWRGLRDLLSGAGAELARGRSLDLRLLPPGRHALRAVLLDGGSGGAVASFLVERGRDDGFRLIRGTAARD